MMLKSFYLLPMEQVYELVAELFDFHSYHLSVMVMRKLEPILADITSEVGFTLRWSATYHRVKTETNNHSYLHSCLWAI